MPAPLPDVVLTAEQIASFHEHGFLSIPRITSPAEVELLRSTLTRLFTERAGWQEGAQFDLVAGDDDHDSALTQIIQPVNYAPQLRDTQFRANAGAIARQLLGAEASASFEHSILKGAREGAPTPWHQDEAYRAADAFEYDQISIWMPLQDASAERGCLQYIRGSHKRGVLRHRRVNDDPTVHSIETHPDEFDLADAVVCPVPAGGAVIHAGRMIHSAGPNTTDEPRLAYTLAFELPPRPSATVRRFDWNEGVESADIIRRRAWLRRGGVAKEVVRRARYHELYKPRRLAFELRRLAGRRK
ncbi:MAG: phytanoyl-CoA dioxygenase family protein [Solirubrobacteraceae bacterium]|nr:phytanoyl-CoA dioxygenase family protein [Solirubrobacteraceae bacterium]